MTTLTIVIENGSESFFTNFKVSCVIVCGTSLGKYLRIIQQNNYNLLYDNYIPRTAYV